VAPALRRTEVVLLVAAPIVLGLGRALLVPFNDQKWDQMLTSMTTHHSRNALGWSLAVVAAALLVITALALVRLVPGRPRLTVPALIGVACGWIGTVGVATGGLVMGDMSQSSARAEMVDVLTRFNEGSGNTLFFLVIAGVIGNVLLAVALTRSGVVTRGTAVLLAVGAVTSLVGAPGPVKPIAVSGAVLLLGGHALLLRGRPQQSAS
jgi:hypothetical protein